MVEEKREFAKKRQLTDDEIKTLLQAKVGNAILVNNWPENTQKHFKITAEPRVKKFDEGTDKESVAVYWDVEWKYKDNMVPLCLRTSIASHDKFMEKKTELEFEYVGKYSIFSFGVENNKKYHSVSKPLEKDPQEFADPMEVINNIDNEAEVPKEADTSEIADWVSKFKESVTAFNTQQDTNKTPDQKKKLSEPLCVITYFKTKHPEEYKAIQTEFAK